MNLWRISNYVNLDGAGGLRQGARWHSRGRKIVYLADSPTGALLENLVHSEINPEKVPIFYTRLKIWVPDDLAIQEISPADADDWADDVMRTRGFGDAWLAAHETCLARVPSVITTEAWNYLLNPAHSDASQVKIIGVTQQRYDPRLLRFRIVPGK